MCVLGARGVCRRPIGQPEILETRAEAFEHGCASLGRGFVWELDNELILDATILVVAFRFVERLPEADALFHRLADGAEAER